LAAAAVAGHFIDVCKIVQEQGKVMNKSKVFLMLFCAVLLAGCNTVQGVGKDVEKAGEAIQKSTK
jgi:Entericidin EcnA/B family.